MARILQVIYRMFVQPFPNISVEDAEVEKG
jgi:hypothetical protein